MLTLTYVEKIPRETISVRPFFLKPRNNIRTTGQIITPANAMRITPYTKSNVWTPDWYCSTQTPFLKKKNWSFFKIFILVTQLYVAQSRQTYEKKYQKHYTNDSQNTVPKNPSVALGRVVMVIEEFCRCFHFFRKSLSSFAFKFFSSGFAFCFALLFTNTEFLLMKRFEFTEKCVFSAMFVLSLTQPFIVKFLV